MEDSRQIFTSIYKNHIWGGRKGWKFYSGSGSHTRKIIKPYIQYIKNFVELNHINSICDIGCGDFYVMREILKDTPNVKYYGIDVVEELIKWNNKRFKENKNWHFLYADAGSDDKIPKADLLVIRQVLQHLDNTSILKVLSRLPDYKYAIITEHITKEEKCSVYNIEKQTNDTIRAANGSGIYLDKKPFNLSNISHVLAYEGKDGTQIRTSLVAVK